MSTGAARLRRLDMRRLHLGRPALAVHGGAGAPAHPLTEERRRGEEAGMGRALEAGWARLEASAPALDAVEAAVASMEADGSFNAGRGAVRTSEGTRELDAAIMDGAGGATGAVCAVTGRHDAVRLAGQVAALPGTVLVAGAGVGSSVPAQSAPTSGVGTVGAVALDANGHLAAATSTGGRAGQVPGRVGDTPIPGAGTWAADGTVAVSATGAGEAFLLAGVAHLVDWQRRAGADLGSATLVAFEEVNRWGGAGGAVILGADGELVAAFDAPFMARGWRHAGGETIEVLGGGRAP